MDVCSTVITNYFFYKDNKNGNATIPSLFQGEIIGTAIRASFVKLNPAALIKNPVMFTVEVGTLIMLLVTIYIGITGDTTQGTLAYNGLITLILLLTILFANFAEAIAEARGKAQAESLRKTRQETPAKVIRPVGNMHTNERSEGRTPTGRCS